MRNLFGTQNEAKREFWIERILSEIPSGLTILDAGAGDQHHKKNCSHLNYVSQDSCQYNGIGNRDGLQTGKYDYGKIDIVGDIIDIPKEDCSFDVILCTEVLEHIPNPELAIKEFSRLLKIGGKLILTAPFCSLSHFAPDHYCTGFNIYWYQHFLPKYNFKIFSCESYGNYFEYLSQEIHRLPYVLVDYGGIQSSPEERELFENMINVLDFYNQKTRNSYQLLNFGFLVEAEKE